MALRTTPTKKGSRKSENEDYIQDVVSRDYFKPKVKYI